MKKKKLTFMNIMRRLIQLASFVLIPGLFISSFAALKDVYQVVLQGSFTLSAYGYQLLILIAVIPVTMLLGRFFCGYLCAFGSMGDFLWFIAGKIHKKRLNISEKTDRFLKSFKYVILVFLVVFVWTLGITIFDSTMSPWTIFGMYASFSGWPGATYLFTVGAALLLMIIVGSFFVERFFCRYFCPLGAVFSVISLIRPFKIKKPRAECGACKLCTNNCPMGIALYKTDVIRSGECINCMKCIESCYRNNVTVKLAPPVAAACAAASIAGLYYMGNLAASVPATSEVAADVEMLSAVTTVEEESGPYEDGTYEGSANGFRGTTEVEVTVENGYIEDITITSTGDDNSYISRAENSVIPAILLTQSTDVSTVSGATFSSNAIIDAVADALSLDSCNTSDSETGNTMCQTEDTTETDTSEIEQSETSADAMQQDSSDTASDLTSDSSVSDEATDNSFSDGTYTGSGSGFRGTTTVSVTVADGKITDITVVSYQDDAPYFERAESDIIASVLTEQSVDVSTVSGATYSSNGILEAIADALDLSFTATVSENSSGHHGGGPNH